MTDLATVTPGDVDAALAACGVNGGDVLFLHGDAIVTAEFPPATPEERCDRLIEAILMRLGPAGTLVMPTFTYSFTCSEPFDVRHSPSAVGAISERFRNWPGVLRSCNPMFSVAALGRFAHVFATSRANECFGRDTAFAKLHQLDARICCAGCSFDRATFVHYVEERAGVDYRFHKKFTGTVVQADGRRRQAICRYFVRDLDRDTATDLSRLRARLLETGKLSVSSIGRVAVVAVGAHDFFETATAMLKEDPRALIREGTNRRAA
ncbi:MAG: AAC(3) family N-acetyltransferase [Rhodospirillales bacterium]